MAGGSCARFTHNDDGGSAVIVVSSRHRCSGNATLAWSVALLLQYVGSAESAASAASFPSSNLRNRLGSLCSSHIIGWSMPCNESPKDSFFCAIERACLLIMDSTRKITGTCCPAPAGAICPEPSSEGPCVAPRMSSTANGTRAMSSQIFNKSFEALIDGAKWQAGSDFFLADWDVDCWESVELPILKRDEVVVDRKEEEEERVEQSADSRLDVEVGEEGGEEVAGLSAEVVVGEESYAEDYAPDWADYYVPVADPRDIYVVGRELAGGSMGMAHLCYNKDTEDMATYVLKTMSKARWGGEWQGQQEIAMMRGAWDEEVGRTLHLDVCMQDDDNLYLVLEYCRGGELAEWVRFMSPDQIGAALYGVVQGLQQCHSVGIVHKDVHMSNIFVTLDSSLRGVRAPGHGDVKLADFGLAVAVPEGGLPMAEWREPMEWNLPAEACGPGGLIDLAVDMWQVGNLLYDCLFGRLPYETDLEATREGRWVHWEDWRSVDGRAVELLEQLLQPDHRLRPTAEEVLQNEWLLDCIAREGSPQEGLAAPRSARCRRMSLPPPSSKTVFEAAAKASFR
eukprot:jgi/Mesen1/1098/ME000123S00270